MTSVEDKRENTKIIDEMLHKAKLWWLYINKTGKNGRINENGWASTELITKNITFNG